MRLKPTLLLLLLNGLIQSPLAAVTYGFADQGFHQASIRTMYDSTQEGTAYNPLTITSPCLWADAMSGNGCPSTTAPSPYTAKTVYSQSN